jgi:hypothetical protein
MRIRSPRLFFSVSRTRRYNSATGESTWRLPADAAAVVTTRDAQATVRHPLHSAAAPGRMHVPHLHLHRPAQGSRAQKAEEGLEEEGLEQTVAAARGRQQERIETKVRARAVCAAALRRQRHCFG